ncbi:MAG: AsmA family protein [Pseudomonadota bacterium]
MNTRPSLDLQGYRPANMQHPEAQPAPPPPGTRRVRRKRKQRRRQQPKRSSGILSVFLWLIGIFVVIGGGLAAAVTVYSPAELVRGELVRQVKANTGRDLLIAGTPSLTFYPSIGVSLPNVTLTAPPQMQGGPLLKADRINVSVGLIALLSQQVVIEQVKLDRPVIDLRIDRNGRPTWDFASWRKPKRYAALPSSVRPIRSDAATSSDIHPTAVALATPMAISPELLDALQLRSLRINDGALRYFDERSGTAEGVSGLNIRIDGRRTSDPMSAVGDLVWNGQKLNVNARLETLRGLLTEKPARVSLDLKSQPVNTTFNGNITLKNSVLVVGKTELAAPSLAAFTRWIGTELPNGKPLGDLSLVGELRASPADVSLRGATIRLGKTKASGAISAQLNRARPLIKANLRISQLDIDKLSAHFSDAKAVPRAKPTSLPSTTAGKANSSPRSIEEILRGTSTDSRGAGRFSPQVRGFRKNQGWDRKPIAAAALKLVDANASLLIEGLRVSGLSIGQTTLRTSLNNGNAQTDIQDIKLYGGRGRGRVNAAAASGGLKVGMNLTINGVSAQPLLKDAAEIDLIAGRGNLFIALGGNGVSQQAIMSSLAGRAKFSFNDGAIVGWNIPGMLRGLQTGQISNLTKSEAQKTDFSELAADFTVSRGVANTQNLRMISPLMRLAGSGNTDIGKRQLDMILRPKLVASLAGQGGQQNLTGIEVPVRVTGPWADPQIKPDLSGVLKNPNQVVDTVKSIGEKLKGKNAGQIVNELFGKKNGQQGGGAGGLLNNLFKN